MCVCVYSARTHVCIRRVVWWVRPSGPPSPLAIGNDRTAVDVAICIAPTVVDWRMTAITRDRQNKKKPTSYSMQVVKYPKPAQKKETRRNQILWRYISSLECLPAPAEKEGKNKKGNPLSILITSSLSSPEMNRNSPRGRPAGRPHSILLRYILLRSRN